MTRGLPRIRYVTVDTADADVLASFWAEALGYEVAARAPYLLLKDPEEAGPHLHVQRQPGLAEPHLHLDLFTPDRPAERARLEGLGAVVVGAQAENGMEWDVLRAPGGQIFCLFDES